MLRKSSTFLTVSAIVVTATMATAAFAVAAEAQPASVIGPNQPFVGLVNGRQVNATVDVECPGPLRVGQMGHPTDGQTLGVSPSSSAARVGNTGSRGQSVVAQFVTTSAASASSVTFTQYGSQPLPTTPLLPCYGSGVVVFTPKPTSPTAHSATVTVKYLPTCTAIVCPVVTSNNRRDGTIAGQLGYEGGAYPGTFHPTAGLVMVAGPKMERTVSVPGSGDFTISLSPGRYKLTGCGGTNDTQCGPSQKVTVRPGKTVQVQIAWLLAPNRSPESR